MFITQTNLFTIIKAEEDMILVDEEGYGATILYLGIYDSPDNYTEIPKSEYVEPESDDSSDIFTDDIFQRIFNEEVNR